MSRELPADATDRQHGPALLDTDAREVATLLAAFITGLLIVGAVLIPSASVPLILAALVGAFATGRLNHKEARR